jgi:hypothetical protein
MAWLKKKSDPISDRSRTLNKQIAELESQIKRLDAELQRNQSPSRSNAPVRPPASGVSRPQPGTQATTPMPALQEPIFEAVDQNRLKARGEPASTPEHYNELGVRKYDLPALWRRIRNHFRGPATTNPKLVSYLAAGGIQGLRPLRYEKRVARNRFIVLVAFLFFILLGTIMVFWRHH